MGPPSASARCAAGSPRQGSHTPAPTGHGQTAQPEQGVRCGFPTYFPGPLAASAARPHHGREFRRLHRYALPNTSRFGVSSDKASPPSCLRPRRPPPRPPAGRLEFQLADHSLSRDHGVTTGMVAWRATGRHQWNDNEVFPHVSGTSRHQRVQVTRVPQGSTPCTSRHEDRLGNLSQPLSIRSQRCL